MVFLSLIQGTPEITDLSTTIQNKATEYEIRCMTQGNDRVKKTFKRFFCFFLCWIE